MALTINNRRIIMESNYENVLVQRLAKLKGKLQKELKNTKTDNVEQIQFIVSTLKSVNVSFILATKILEESNNRG